MPDSHANARLEAFSDGVFAFALTLLIVDVKLPSTEAIADTHEFWRALLHLGPSVFAFLLSFCVILICWVNHHATLKLVEESAPSFIYANGFLLLTVVIVPFPTALLGDFLLTDRAAPAVVLYDAVLASQALGWILLSGSALKHGLASDENASYMLRAGRRNGYFALGLYSVLSIAALWIPLAVAIVTTMAWSFWLVFGIRMKQM